MMGGLTSDAIDDISCIANKDWVDNQTFPLLHRIVLNLHGKPLSQALTEDPTTINHTDATGRTALHWAAARGNHHALTTLLTHGGGADPNLLDAQHSSALSYAAEKDHTACVRALLAAGAHTDPLVASHHRVGSPLNCAARNARERNLIQALLDAGAEVDAAGVDGRTPLLHAARTDNAAFVEVLLERGASTDVVSVAGQTALTAAVAGNCHGVVEAVAVTG
jgi:ankyrin repeat protein